MKIIRVFVCLCIFTFLLFVQNINAQESHSSSYTAEIERVINYIQHSDCLFFRNGKTYSSQQAASHLRFKLSRSKGKNLTTEQFIATLASKSSITKKPYHIKCAKQSKTIARQWLLDHLSNFRSQQPSTY